MADLRVEMSSDKDKIKKERTGTVGEESPGVSYGAVLVLLAGSAVLAAAVYYPNSLIVADLGKLIEKIENQTNPTGYQTFRDCYDVHTRNPNSTSGVYTVYPGGLRRGIEVLCDMEVDNGGWLVRERERRRSVFNVYRHFLGIVQTFLFISLEMKAQVIQKRTDGSLDFFRDWTEYQFGFGNGFNEFWIGNEVLHLLTSQAIYELRVDMADFEGESRFAKYKLFLVGSRESKFRLTVGGYSGTAGDSLSSHNGMQFSTKDVDNDLASGQCATSFKGGFWYSNCHTANPNGQYLRGEHESMADGVNWKTWRGYKYSLQTMSMKIKPL
uniref:Ficolin-2-like isoform X2 n=1 Tax=Crassostrea virginica TaxID=6565 RepID=A0A8B8DE56_CRAVI|nr:ficolin-2-like isoform X2 [Crassostrea virginica]